MGFCIDNKDAKIDVSDKGFKATATYVCNLVTAVALAVIGFILTESSIFGSLVAVNCVPFVVAIGLLTTVLVISTAVVLFKSKYSISEEKAVFKNPLLKIAMCILKLALVASSVCLLVKASSLSTFVGSSPELVRAMAICCFVTTLLSGITWVCIGGREENQAVIKVDKKKKPTIDPRRRLKARVNSEATRYDSVGVRRRPRLERSESEFFRGIVNDAINSGGSVFVDSAYLNAQQKTVQKEYIKELEEVADDLRCSTVNQQSNKLLKKRPVETLGSNRAKSLSCAPVGVRGSECEDVIRSEKLEQQNISPEIMNLMTGLFGDVLKDLVKSAFSGDIGGSDSVRVSLDRIYDSVKRKLSLKGVLLNDGTHKAHIIKMIKIEISKNSNPNKKSCGDDSLGLASRGRRKKPTTSLLEDSMSEDFGAHHFRADNDLDGLGESVVRAFDDVDSILLYRNGSYKLSAVEEDSKVKRKQNEQKLSSEKKKESLQKNGFNQKGFEEFLLEIDSDSSVEKPIKEMKKPVAKQEITESTIKKEADKTVLLNAEPCESKTSQEVKGLLSDSTLAKEKSRKTSGIFSKKKKSDSDFSSEVDRQSLASSGSTVSLKRALSNISFGEGKDPKAIERVIKRLGSFLKKDKKQDRKVFEDVVDFASNIDVKEKSKLSVEENKVLEDVVDFAVNVDFREKRKPPVEEKKVLEDVVDSSANVDFKEKRTPPVEDKKLLEDVKKSGKVKEESTAIETKGCKVSLKSKLELEKQRKQQQAFCNRMASTTKRHGSLSVLNDDFGSKDSLVGNVVKNPRARLTSVDLQERNKGILRRAPSKSSLAAISTDRALSKVSSINKKN